MAHSSNRGAWNNSKIFCQVCDKPGHTALHCWRWYDYHPQPPPHAHVSHFADSDHASNEASLLGVQSTLDDPLWYPDSGATHHVTKDSSVYSSKQPYHGTKTVKMGNGSGLSIANIGSTSFSSPSTHKSLVLKNLLHVPLITKNLLSVSSFARDNNVLFTFTANRCYVVDQVTKNILLQGTLKDGLYSFPMLHNHLPSSSIHNISFTRNTLTANVWHQRLGHCNMDILKKIFHNNDIRCSNNISLCSSCLLGKHMQLPFHSSTTVYTKPLELVFVDVWGPSPIPASNGARYYISFVDAFSKYTWIYFLHAKSQVPAAFQKFKSLAENQTCSKLRSLQSENAREFLCLKQVLDQHGIHHRLICPHTHEQNGVVERKHRHIVDMGLTLLATASLPRRFWVEAFPTSTHIINVLPTPVLHNSNPYTMLFNKNPNYVIFKVFGCACFPLLRPYNRNKFDFHSQQCLFLGYSVTNKGYIYV